MFGDNFLEILSDDKLQTYHTKLHQRITKSNYTFRIYNLNPGGSHRSWISQPKQNYFSNKLVDRFLSLISMKSFHLNRFGKSSERFAVK